MTDVARFVTFAVTFAAGSALALGKLGNLGPSALGSILTLVRRPIITVVLATAVALGTTVAMPVAGGAQEDPARETEQVVHRQALVAVEVKLRRSARAGLPADALDTRRLVRLRRTLVDYATNRGAAALGLRIDLVSVTPAGDAWRLSRWPGIDAW